MVFQNLIRFEHFGFGVVHYVADAVGVNNIEPQEEERSQQNNNFKSAIWSREEAKERSYSRISVLTVQYLRLDILKYLNLRHAEYYAEAHAKP